MTYQHDVATVNALALIAASVNVGNLMIAMNISLTPEQYKTLLLTTYLGNWMVNSHQVETDKTFDTLASHVYSYAESFGLAGLVELDADNGQSYPTRELEELAAEHMDAYDN